MTPNVTVTFAVWVSSWPKRSRDHYRSPWATSWPQRSSCQVSSLHIYTFVVSRAFMAGAASQAGDADSSRAPGLTSGLQGSVNVHRGALLLVPQWQCISSFVFLHFCHTCSLCRVELVVQFPARGSTQVLLCLFPGVLWLWHFLYSVGPHPVSSLHIYTFVVSRAFMVGAASQAGDADSSRAPGLTSGL